MPAQDWEVSFPEVLKEDCTPKRELLSDTSLLPALQALPVKVKHSLCHNWRLNMAKLSNSLSGGVQGIKYAGAVKPGTAYVAQPVPQQEVIVQPETVYVQSTPQPVVVQPVVHRTGGFNDIFNVSIFGSVSAPKWISKTIVLFQIPISALQAVNQYLNNRQKGKW